MRPASILVASAAGLIGSLALAQSTTQPAERAPADPSSQSVYRIAAGMAHQFDTGLQSPDSLNLEDGDFSLTRYGLGVSVHYPLAGSAWLIDHSLVYEYDDYQFSGASAFTRNLDSGGRRVTLTEEPWEDTQLINYSLRGTYLINREWSAFGGPILGMAQESGADLSDSLSWGLTGGVRQQVNRDLAVGLGVIAIYGLDDELSLLPIVILEWNINDRLAIRNARPQPGLRGTAGAEIAWAIDSRWELAAGWSYDRREFRLNDEGVASEGIGRNDSFPTYLRLNFTPDDRLALSAMVGYLFGGELRLKDSQRTLGELDYDNAPFAGVGLSYRF